jgi:hypothetical protein
VMPRSAESHGSAQTSDCPQLAAEIKRRHPNGQGNRVSWFKPLLG